MEELTCPYCSHKFKVDYEDLSWHDGDVEDKICRQCDKTFEVHTYITTRFACEEKEEA